MVDWLTKRKTSSDLPRSSTSSGPADIPDVSNDQPNSDIETETESLAELPLGLPQFSHSTATIDQTDSANNVHDKDNEYDTFPSALAEELEAGAFRPKDVSQLNIPQQIVNGKTRRLQSVWFDCYPWLHYSRQVRALLCYSCARATALSLLTLNTKSQNTFISSGFSNWKKALQKFAEHEKSGCHKHAVAQLLQVASAPPIEAQLSAQKASEQATARVALAKLFTSIQFLARQGMALRGHEEHESNLMQLLQLRSEDASELKSWLSRTTNFLSPDSQNEILRTLSDSVLRIIANNINTSSKQFAVVVDGTQDSCGVEQESICVRYVDEHLDVIETCVGLFTPPDTTGKTLASVIIDALTRLTLPVSNLRAQTYDGAANMSGRFNGCQSIIAQQHPLAIFFHCTAHCANLTAEHTSESSSLIRDSLQTIHEVGVLYKRSGKYKHIFDDVAANAYESPTTLKPLCPTRWLCRVRSITAILHQYEAVLNSLEEMSSQTTGETATKASALLDRFRKASTILGLKISFAVFSLLEELNRSLQAPSSTVSGMFQAVEAINTQLWALRTEQQFNNLFDGANAMAEQLDIEPVSLPRQRRPPSRYTGPAQAYQADTAQDHFRSVYFTVIDRALAELNNRFDKSAQGFETYLSLEKMLLSGEIDDSVCQRYPELCNTSLNVQLQMFRSSYTVHSLGEAHGVFKKMVPEVRNLFPAVEQLIRLMLICPVTSCTAERSFSALRRLKNWMRSTMTQQRLNSVVVCHVNKDILDRLNIMTLAAEFARKTPIRENIFGQFPLSTSIQ
jgi:hypothetical protein